LLLSAPEILERRVQLLEGLLAESVLELFLRRLYRKRMRRRPVSRESRIVAVLAMLGNAG
jgi:hypothetical protein